MRRESRECGHYAEEVSLISWRKGKEGINKPSNPAYKQSFRLTNEILNMRRKLINLMECGRILAIN